MKFSRILTLAAVLTTGLFSPLYQAGIIHVNGITVLPNSSPGTVGSTVEYKELASGKTAGSAILGSDGKYALSIDVDLSGINVNTTVSYNARVFGNNIFVGSGDVKKIDVYNSRGQLVKKVNFSVKNGITQGYFDTNGLSSGMYFVNVIRSDGSLTLKTNIYEGQSSNAPDFTKDSDIKNSLNEKSTFLTNNYEVKIISPGGEYKTFLDTLIFTVPSEGNESWESPIHALQYGESANYIHGYVQKGPFITGSNILIQELNTALSPNGTSYNISTEDNFGSFYLESEISTNYIEVIATGFYFNEVTGSLSDANLTLRAITAVNDTLNCNINILTSLAKKRIVYLITTEGKTFAEAKQQAQNEILAIFSINGTGAADFEDMDISSDGDSNGMLLAISAILQGNNTVAELSLLLSTITEDIKIDGILNDTASKNEVIENAKLLSLPSVRKNIEDRYEALGLTTVIPNFEQYINNIWVNQLPTCQITKLQCIQGSDILSALDGKPLVIGSQATLQISSSDTDGSVTKVKIYLDNVLKDSTSMGTYSWTIADTTKFHAIKAVAFDDDGAFSVDSVNYELYGYKWIPATSSTPWSIRYIGGVVFNDKMYVCNYSNPKAMYSSANGVNWTLVTDSLPWDEYLDGFLLNEEYDSKMWFLCDGILWNSVDGVNWIDQNVSTIYSEGILLMFNGSMHALFNDGSTTKIYKYINNDFTAVSSDLGFEVNIEIQQLVEHEGKIYIYERGSNDIMYSEDLVNWTTVSDQSPWEPYELIVFKFNNKFYTIDGVGLMWISDDGINWTKDFIAPAHGNSGVIIYNNTIWGFETWNKVYFLKKYFE